MGRHDIDALARHIDRYLHVAFLAKVAQRGDLLRGEGQTRQDHQVATFRHRMTADAVRIDGGQGFEMRFERAGLENDGHIDIRGQNFVANGRAVFFIVAQNIKTHQAKCRFSGRLIGRCHVG